MAWEKLSLIPLRELGLCLVGGARGGQAGGRAGGWVCSPGCQRPAVGCGSLHGLLLRRRRAVNAPGKVVPVPRGVRLHARAGCVRRVRAALACIGHENKLISI